MRWLNAKIHFTHHICLWGGRGAGRRGEDKLVGEGFKPLGWELDVPSLLLLEPSVPGGYTGWGPLNFTSKAGARLLQPSPSLLSLCPYFRGISALLHRVDFSLPLLDLLCSISRLLLSSSPPVCLLHVCPWSLSSWCDSLEMWILSRPYLCRLWLDIIFSLALLQWVPPFNLSVYFPPPGITKSMKFTASLFDTTGSSNHSISISLTLFIQLKTHLKTLQARVCSLLYTH